MCGRYVLAQAARFERELQSARVSWSFQISYNVAPTQNVPVVRAVDGEREGLMSRIHNAGNNPHRMPAVLQAADLDAWLEGGAGEARTVLGPYPQDVMVAYEVSTRVNSPKNNDERLIEPVRLAQ